MGAALARPGQRADRRLRAGDAEQRRRRLVATARRGRPQRPVDDTADRRLRQPERRRDGDRVPDRPRAPADRLPRRPSRPRVVAPAAGGLPACAREGGDPVRRRPRSCRWLPRRERPHRRARASPPRRASDRDLRGERHVGIETIAAAASSSSRCPRICPWSGSTTSPSPALSEPLLTTVDQSVERMGFEAVRMVLALIDDPARPPAGDPSDPPRRARLLPPADGARVTVGRSRLG